MLDRAQQVAGHPVGEFLLVTIKLDDVPAVQVFSPRNHRSSPSGASPRRLDGISAQQSPLHARRDHLLPALWAARILNP
jgi:hypothetical protein